PGYFRSPQPFYLTGGPSWGLFLRPRGKGLFLPPALSERRHRSLARAASFDHLVGEREQPVRNLEAERLGGPEVDDKLKFYGLHYRKIARPLASENAADIDAGLTVGIDIVRSIADETSGVRVFTPIVHGRNSIMGRHRDNLIEAAEEECIVGD